MKDFWDARYGEEQYAYGEQANTYFAASLEQLSPGRILLPGEGEGRNAVHAARAGWSVDAVDYSAAGKAKAEALAAAAGVALHYDVEDLADYIPEPAAYDAVALIFLHLPTQLRTVVHARRAQALRPGGTIIVEAFSTQQLAYEGGGPRNPDLLYTREQLRDDFRGLQVVEDTQLLTTLREGPYHDGRADVIRLLLRKP